jgi:hypothetical protein
VNGRTSAYPTKPKTEITNKKTTVVMRTVMAGHLPRFEDSMLDARMSCAIRYDPDHQSVNSRTTGALPSGACSPHVANDSQRGHVSASCLKNSDSLTSRKLAGQAAKVVEAARS